MVGRQKEGWAWPPGRQPRVSAARPARAARQMVRPACSATQPKHPAASAVPTAGHVGLAMVSGPDPTVQRTKVRSTSPPPGTCLDLVVAVEAKVALHPQVVVRQRAIPAKDVLAPLALPQVVGRAGVAATGWERVSSTPVRDPEQEQVHASLRGLRATSITRPYTPAVGARAGLAARLPFSCESLAPAAPGGFRHHIKRINYMGMGRICGINR